MGKRWFLIAGILPLASLLMAGCGIPQEEYDAVVAERHRYQSDLTEAKSQIETLQSEVESLQGQLSTVQGDYDTLKQSVAKAKSYGDFLDKYYFVPPYVVPPYRITDPLVSEWELIVEKWDNPIIEVKWAAAEYSRSKEDFAFFAGGVWDVLWDEIR